jgi:hypothetical protein
MIIDLDAHQGNGHEHDFMNNKSIYILDMYNSDIYPRDATAKTRIDLPVAIKVILSIINSILWMFKVGTLRFKFTISRFLRFLEPDRFPILCNFLACSLLQWFFGFVIGLTPVTSQIVAVFLWCMWQFHTHQSYTTTEKYLDLLSQALEVMCSSSLFLECW